MARFTTLLVGVGELALGAALAFTGVGAALAPYLIVAGGSTIIAGLGTALVNKGPVKGFSTTERNPIAPWQVCYGRVRTGGTLIYQHTWGQDKKMLDMVMVLAAHPCEAIDAVLFDLQRVQIDATGGRCNASGTTVTWTSGTTKFQGNGWGAGQYIQINGINYVIASVVSSTVIHLTTSAGTQTNVTYMGGGSAPIGALPGSGTSFSPVQQHVNITKIQRTNGVVTVTLAANIPYLMEGDHIFITEDGAGSLTANGFVGTYGVAQIIQQDSSTVVFTYLCGGADITILGHGHAETLWADYGRKVYFEVLLGKQTLGETFAGMLAGTPFDGDMGHLVTPLHPGSVGDDPEGNQPNPWTQDCSCQGKTVVHIRLHYSADIFKGGIPQISFLMRGKNDILDPRTSPMSHGYTENSALCIADFLSNPTYGFKAAYGTEIPYSYLIAAANTCDESVPLALSTASPPLTEPAYTCNGKFELSTKRGTVLEQLLSSCAGRLSYVNGQYLIWPAAWIGNSFAIGSDPGGDVTSYPAFSEIAAGAPTWRPTIPIRDLYNGVKGTYISKADKWVSADFPPYVQDALHGYGPYSPDIPHSDLNLAADGGDRRWKEIQLPFTISAATAQRLAKIELLRSRQFGTGTLVLNMTAYPITALDLGLVTLPFFGWTEKQVEVVASRLKIEEGSEQNGPRPIIDLDIQEVSPDIYEWVTDEELSPQGLSQPGKGRNFFATEIVPGFSAPYRWAPAGLMPLIGDALFVGPKVDSPPVNAGPATFGLQAAYGLENDGSVNIEMEVQGDIPPSVLASIESAQVLCVPGTSGNLSPGQYVVAVSALDTNSPPNNAKLSTPFVVTIPAPSPTADTGSIEVLISWPAGCVGGEIFLGKLDQPLKGGTKPGATGYFYQQTVAASTTDVTLTDFRQDGPGAPDSSFDHLAIVWKKVLHGGPWAQQVQAVTPTTITIGGEGMTSGMWAGRVLTLIGKADPTQELILLNMPVANSSGSATFSPPTGIAATLTGLMIDTPTDGDTVTIAGKTYTFEDTLTDVDGHVQINTLIGTFANLVNAINLTGTPGVDYAQSTTANPAAFVLSTFHGRMLTLQALVPGASGNSLTASVTPSIQWRNSGNFSGGTNAGTFILTIGPNSAGDQLPDLTTLLAPDDLVLMRFSPTFGPQSFSDPLIANPYYPQGAINVESGHIVVVLTGPDAGDAVAIESVGQDINGNYTEFFMASPWAVQPNDGDIITIVEAAFGPEFHTHQLASSRRGQISGTVAAPKITNLPGQTWLFTALAQNSASDNGRENFAPYREVFIFGSHGTRQITGGSPPITVGMLPSDQIIDADATHGPVTYLLLPFELLPNMKLFIQKVDASSNVVRVQCAVSSPQVDFINGQPYVDLLAQWDYVVVSVSQG